MTGKSDTTADLFAWSIVIHQVSAESSHVHLIISNLLVSMRDPKSTAKLDANQQELRWMTPMARRSSTILILLPTHGMKG